MVTSSRNKYRSISIYINQKKTIYIVHFLLSLPCLPGDHFSMDAELVFGRVFAVGQGIFHDALPVIDGRQSPTQRHRIARFHRRVQLQNQGPEEKRARGKQMYRLSLCNAQSRFSQSHSPEPTITDIKLRTDHYITYLWGRHRPRNRRPPLHHPRRKFDLRPKVRPR